MNREKLAAPVQIFGAGSRHGISLHGVPQTRRKVKTIPYCRSQALGHYTAFDRARHGSTAKAPARSCSLPSVRQPGKAPNCSWLP